MAQTKGQAWAQSVRDAYELNEAQEVLVDLCGDTMDVIDRLPATAVIEKRQQKLTLMRGLAQLGLPDSDDGNPTSTASQRGRKAARARWDRQL